MSFLKDINNFTYLININVKPNSKSQKITDDGKFLKIQIQSKAVKNKANIELINMLKKQLKITSNQIKIISGVRSTNKIIQINYYEKVEYKTVINRLLH
jgi:uncharacterized protein (TIGR00251 family)